MIIFNEPTKPKADPNTQIAITRPPLSYYFRPDRWKAWWLGKKTKWANEIIEENKTLHPNEAPPDEKGDLDLITYSEQFVYRTTRCECYAMGKCKCCGCPADEKMIQAKETCKWGMWNEMMSRRDWIAYKIKNAIKFKL